MVDIVIPVYRPDERFYRLVKMLKKQKLQINRYIFIYTENKISDKNNRASYEKRLKEDLPKAEIFYISKAEFDHAKTRRMGADFSSAPILVFMTQDAVPKDEYLLTHLIEAFSNPQVAVAYARQLPNPDCKEIERFTRQFNYSEESKIKTKDDLKKLGIKTYFCSDVCAAYRKEDYIALGGFVKKAIFNEDMLFAAKAIQAGKAVAYVAEAMVYHSHNEEAVGVFRRNFDLAVSQAEHREVFEGISSETEGIKLIKQTAAYLWKKRKAYLIPKLIFYSGMKYLGYQMGKHYVKLPKNIILWCTSNREYWRNYEKDTRRI